MVFGNTGDRSATGVGFTRNPATGAKEFYGEFLVNAQGEDVVAGIRTPQPIGELEQVMPQGLRAAAARSPPGSRSTTTTSRTSSSRSRTTRSIMLQTRSGKRTGYAAVVIATDLVEGAAGHGRRRRCCWSTPEALRSCWRPASIPRNGRRSRSRTRGLPASPGAACGQVVFTADDAVGVVASRASR